MPLSIVVDQSNVQRSVSLSWNCGTRAVGDIIIISANSEDVALAKLAAPTATGVTFTARVKNDTITSQCPNYLYSGIVTSAGAKTVTMAIGPGFTGNKVYGGTAYICPTADGYSLATTPKTGNVMAGSGQPSLTVTGLTVGSLLICQNGDWAAVAGSRTYRQTVTEDAYMLSVGQAALEDWHFTCTTASTTTGMTTPTGQTYSIALIEVLFSGGGTNYTANPADPEGITDAATPVQDNVRSQADPVGLTDSATSGLDAIRSQADPIGITDAASALVSTGRTQNDAEGITDLASATQDNVRSQADPVGITDSATSTQTVTRTQADPIGITDSANANIGNTRQIDDSEGITDLASATQALARTQADPIGITDTSSVTQALVRQVDDPIGITDGVTADISGATTAYRVWPTGTWPSSDAADYTFYSMGLEVEFTTAGNITAIYWWKATATSPPPSAVGVYDVATQTIIGSAEAVADPGTATGWIKYVLATPIAVTTGVRYQVEVFGSPIGYSAIPYYWDTDPGTGIPGPGASGITNGPIFAPSNGAATNGQQKFTNTIPITYAASGFHAQWYGIDLELTVSGGGGTDYTASQDEPVGITDAASAAQDFVRTQSDPEGITDAALATQDLVRAQVDPIGITDTATALIGTSRQVDDPEGITDSATATQALARTQADPIGITDATSVIQDYVRLLADPVGITDSVTATISGVNYTANINDAIGITDTGIQQAIDYDYILDPDPIGITDSVTAALSGATNVTVNDAEGITDLASSVQDNVRTQTDPIGITDSATAVISGAGSVSVSDPEGITDAVTTTAANARTQSDPIGITDAASINQDFARPIADPVGITDSATGVISAAGNVSVSDPEGITDAATATQALARTQSDPVGITDATSVSQGYSRTQADPIGITDAVSAVLVAPIHYVALITDSIGITDNVQAQKGASKPIDIIITEIDSPWGGAVQASPWGASPVPSAWGGSVARKGSS